MSEGGWHSIIGQVGTWALVLLGWALVNRQNNTREERKEIREFVLDISKRATELRDASFKYHTADSEDKALGADILFKLNIISLRISTLRRYGVLVGSELAKQMRQAITLENFDSANFKKQPIRSGILAGIESATEELTAELDRAFFDHFMGGGMCRSFWLCKEHWRVPK